MPRLAPALFAALLSLTALLPTARAAAIKPPKGASKYLAAMLAGIDDKATDDAKLTKLMANMKKISFDYTGTGASAWEQFLTGTAETTDQLKVKHKTPWGDCGTVVNLFMKVAKDELKISGLQKGDTRERFWTEGAPIVDPKYKSGNVDGKYWMWVSHVWVEGQGGKVFDVLFNKTYPSVENMKATTWHVVETSMAQKYKYKGGREVPKFVVKPTLTMYVIPEATTPPYKKYTTTEPK